MSESACSVSPCPNTLLGASAVLCAASVNPSGVLSTSCGLPVSAGASESTRRRTRVSSSCSLRADYRRWPDTSRRRSRPDPLRPRRESRALSALRIVVGLRGRSWSAPSRGFAPCYPALPSFTEDDTEIRFRHLRAGSQCRMHESTASHSLENARAVATRWAMMP